MNIKELFQEAQRKQLLSDTELAIELIRQWSEENIDHNGIDWRRLHAASNLMAIEQYYQAEPLAEAWRGFAKAEDELARVEARAFARLYADLINGTALGPDGIILPRCSPSQAEPVARKLMALKDEIVEAKDRLVIAKASHMAFMKKHDALREIEQGGKSTAQRLTQEA